MYFCACMYIYIYLHLFAQYRHIVDLPCPRPFKQEFCLLHTFDPKHILGVYNHMYIWIHTDIFKNEDIDIHIHICVNRYTLICPYI